MDKLEHTLKQNNHTTNLVVVNTDDLITQVDFNAGVQELCRRFNIPTSLVTCLMVNNVANKVMQAEGQNVRYHTLKDLNACLTVGDRNWMKFIPEWKYGSPVFIDRLDIGLTRAFYHRYLADGMHPTEAFKEVENRNVEIGRFFDHANGEVSLRRGEITSAWYDYKDLYIYAGRTILGNPVKPADFDLKYQERKGISLS